MTRARTRQEAWAHRAAETVLATRPQEAEDRTVSGHGEGDLIFGLKCSAVATLIECSTRYAILVHVPGEVGYGLNPAEEKAVSPLPVMEPRR